MAKYNLAFLDDDATNGLSINGYIPESNVNGASSTNELIEMLKHSWNYVEKVNAHLVVED